MMTWRYLQVFTADIITGYPLILLDSFNFYKPIFGKTALQYLFSYQLIYVMIKMHWFLVFSRVVAPIKKMFASFCCMDLSVL